MVTLQDGKRKTALLQGARAKPYQVSIDIDLDEDDVSFDGNCSRPMSVLKKT